MGVVTDPAGLSIDTITSAGTTQANATAIVRGAGTTVVRVVNGGANTGVRLPSNCAIGELVEIKSTTPGEAGGAGVLVYPHVGGSIDGNATNAAVGCSACVLRYEATNVWWMQSFFP